MFDDAFRVFKASQYSRSHYLPLVEHGLSFTVGKGHASLTLKVIGVEKVERSPGYRFAQFSICASATTSDGECHYGFGEDDVKLVATQKALSEVVERAVYRVARNITSSRSSNGWACHPSLSKAIASARSELIERDAALAHWHGQLPLTEIDSETLPGWLKSWQKNELSRATRYNRLRVTVGNHGYGILASVFVVDSENCGFVSHASSSNLEQSIRQALGEATRIASIGTSVRSPTLKSPPTDPMDHALLHRDQPFPDWIFGEAASFQTAKSMLPSINSIPSFQEAIFRCGRLFVVQSRSEGVQDLYFGTAEWARKTGQLNFERLRQFGGLTALNPQPHFVP